MYILMKNSNNFIADVFIHTIMHKILFENSWISFKLQKLPFLFLLRNTEKITYNTIRFFKSIVELLIQRQNLF